jgi:hypothetical protein
MANWVLEFEAPVGERLMKRYRSVTTFASLWWCNDKRKFVSVHDPLPKGGSNHFWPIRSVKAFKRFLRNHPELQGVEVILVSRFEGHNVKANYI